MDGNIFVVYTREKENIGLYAIAEKLSRSINLVNYVQGCKTFNACNSWKEAKRIADQWNKDFQANGKQKPSSEW